MAISWPKERRVIGTKVTRLDGPDKATGMAKYSYDINRPGMLHASILRSPYAHAKVKTLDTAEAEKMPGVKAVHVIAGPGKELFYAGDEIVGLAADTEEHAQDGLRAIKIEYEVLDFIVKEAEALKEPNRKTVPGGKEPNNVAPSRDSSTGKIADAFKQADFVHEGDYGVPTISHQCLESHGLVAEWDKEGGLTVWCSTQATFYTADGLSKYFKIPATKVNCITHYMGGGFGSKFGADVQGNVAAELAKKAGAPVKLMLDRAAEITAAGNRPSAYGKIKIAGTKDGKITAYEADTYGGPGVGASGTVGPLPYVYAIPNTKVKHVATRTNTGNQRAMRAPGHPQSCVLTDCPIDDLAAKMGIDPMQVRLLNLPPNAPANDPQSINALRNTIYVDEIKIAADLSKWKEKWHPPGNGPIKGPVKHGIGMALHTWGGAAGKPNDISVTISSDGSVLVQASTQDLGTGERTVLPIVVAEILGLNPHDLTVKVGESPWGRSSGSGGSTTCPGTAPPALAAAIAARDALFEKIASRLGAKAADLAIEPGKIVDKSSNSKSWSWKEACAKLGMDVIKGEGQWQQQPANDPLVKAGLSNNGVGGVQVAEVMVDTETGVVRCTQVVAVQDCGLVINKLCCESQVAGGVIMGVNYALFEDRIMDRATGRQVNPDMEFYKLGGISDMPKIIVHMHDMPDRGVIGIGEPPTISTCAAIGNAVFNAIGARVPYSPFTPDKVLAALTQNKV
jgi:xanthine dehydrogenase YagR molybdenum-binding subunit